MNCTILIPAFNVENWIAHALESVVRQTYHEWDILVVDDGSTDGTCHIVERFMAQGYPTSLLRLDHRGPAHATHHGIRHALGPVVTVLDADDTLMPDSLETVMPSFKKVRAKLGFVWTRFITSGGRAGWTGPLPGKTTLWQALVYKGWWRASHQRFLLKRVYMASDRQLDPSIPFPSDLALAIVMGYTGCNTRWINRVTYWYRQGRQGSISRGHRIDQKLNARRLIHVARAWK